MYYCSVLNHAGDKSVMALGPFHTHGAALARVEDVRRYVCDNFREGHWSLFGTCRRKTDHPRGRFNDELEHEIDSLP